MWTVLKCFQVNDDDDDDDGFLFILIVQNKYNTFGSFGKFSVLVSQLYLDVSIDAWMTRFPVLCVWGIAFWTLRPFDLEAENKFTENYYRSTKLLGHQLPFWIRPFLRRGRVRVWPARAVCPGNVSCCPWLSANWSWPKPWYSAWIYLTAGPSWRWNPIFDWTLWTAWRVDRTWETRLTLKNVVPTRISWYFPLTWTTGCRTFRGHLRRCRSLLPDALGWSFPVWRQCTCWWRSCSLLWWNWWST